ncbi:MAG: hypothetical protein ACRC57_01935 [Sarcina sp.]
MFIKNSLKDFIQSRKIKFENLIIFLVSGNGRNLHKEFLEYFCFDEKTISSSVLF